MSGSVDGEETKSTPKPPLPNAGGLLAPKAGVEAAPNAGVDAAPNAGVEEAPAQISVYLSTHFWQNSTLLSRSLTLLSTDCQPCR